MLASLGVDNLASEDIDGTVILWDVEKRQQMGEPLRGPGGLRASMFSVAFSPNGRMLASGGADGSVVLWDTQRQQRIGEPLKGHDNSLVNSIAFSSSGRSVPAALLTAT
jgi:WD40 repeat protein